MELINPYKIAFYDYPWITLGIFQWIDFITTYWLFNLGGHETNLFINLTGGIFAWWHILAKLILIPIGCFWTQTRRKTRLWHYTVFFGLTIYWIILSNNIGGIVIHYLGFK